MPFVLVLFLHSNFTSLSPLILIYVFFSHVNPVSVYAGLKTNRGRLFLFAWGFSLISGARSIHALVLCQARSVGKYLLLSQSSTSDWWTSVFRHLRYLTSWWDDCQCMFDTGSYGIPSRLKLQLVTHGWLVPLTYLLPVPRLFQCSMSPPLK